MESDARQQAGEAKETVLFLKKSTKKLLLFSVRGDRGSRVN